jgi:diguanylate cyclase (GGDEF)-like protein
MSYHEPPRAPALDALCPMHATVTPTGHIAHAGPTLRKLRPDAPWRGERLLEVFRILRPREIGCLRDLQPLLGRKLYCELRAAPRTPLKAVAVANDAELGLVVNFAFGISVVKAVRDFSLCSDDFAPTDLTIEMLYLIEAQSAAMEASRKLNARLQWARQAAERQAFTDALTGLDNRRALDMALAQMVLSRSPLTLMHLDLDYFKSVNDTLGHAAGDFVLIEVAAAFRKILEPEVRIARVGGDEFVILFPEVLSLARIETVADALIDALEMPREFNSQQVCISGSIGTVIWEGSVPASPETLMLDADFALYASKRAGRARQTLYSPTLREDAQGLGGKPGQQIELWG